MVAVLGLGMLVSCLQVYLDFRDQSQSIDNDVQEIIKVSAAAAQRAVHLLDDRLAQEVVRGLENYNFLYHISIYDDRNNVMAIYDEPIRGSSTLWLTNLIKGQSSDHEFPLYYEDGTYEGKLVLKLNNDTAMAQLYKRALYVFISGMTRNLVLAILLAVVYHYLLTRPLFEIARNFSTLDHRGSRGERLTHLSSHRNDELGFIVNSANDLIGKLEAREQDIEQSENQLRVILNASPNHVFAVNQRGEFVFLNLATAEFYKQPIEALEGESYYELHRDINPREVKTIREQIQFAEHASSSRSDTEQTITDADGNEHIMQVSYIPYKIYGQRCVLIISNDVTARVEAEERVEKLAYFDTLTHLPNRNQIHEQLTRDVITSKRADTHGALFFIDIDDFKRINDTMGHSVGDELLLTLSNRMQTQIRKTETLARLGGDEFILSVPNISSSANKTRELASALAERILCCIRRPLNLEGHDIAVSASIGITLYPDESNEVDKLLGAADTAMYQAKRDGHDRFLIFEPKMSEEANRIVKLETDIRKAMAEDQFEFFLQPLLDGKTRELLGAEALIRWMHPERGQILPQDFIEFLESSPMIGKVGEIMLNKLCQFIYDGRSRGVLEPTIRIAMNISAREFFQPHFVDMVTEALAKFHLHGSCLELEITEGAALQRLDEAISKMIQLKELGITFSLDDFGTGYSSLSYLKQLPVDKVKIDKSFIKDITIDRQDAALVSSIMAIANTLNLKVVAEGVETEDQATWLSFQGDIIFQGYLFDKPLPLRDFEERYLHSNPSLKLPIQ